MIGMLLDAYAADVRDGATLEQLTIEERGRVIRAMAAEEAQDPRDILDAVFVFTIGAMYSEWSGYERSTRTLRPPATWAQVGYHGPVDGVANYREGS